MSDHLVESLRIQATWSDELASAELLNAAADEIEQLRAELTVLRSIDKGEEKCVGCFGGWMR